MGVWCYFLTVPNTEINLPADDRGIIVFADRDLKERQFHFIIDEMDIDRRTVVVSIQDLEGIPAKILGFQFPYHVLLTKETSRAWHVINDTNRDLTYVWCTECPDKLVLTWVGVVQRRTYSTYAIVIPFSNTPAIQDRQKQYLMDKLQTDVMFASLEGNYYTVSVVLPEGAVMQFVEPTPVLFGRANGRLRFYYDVSTYYREGLSALAGYIRLAPEPTVYLIFTSGERQDDKESIVFVSGLLIGVGASALVSGTAEVVRERSPPKNTRLSKRQRNLHMMLFAVAYAIALGVFAALLHYFAGRKGEQVRNTESPSF